jgi:ectoine hydroxylase-related dioxygenase (phytanoyl-CoA dioxygenase family)
LYFVSWSRITIIRTQIKNTLAENGYVVLHNFFRADVIDAVRGDLAEWIGRQARQLLADGVIDDLHEAELFETRWLRIVEGGGPRLKTIREDLHMSSLFSLFFDPQLLDIVESVLGPEIRLYPNYTVRPKLPNDTLTQVLWHQDAAYTASGQHGHDADAGDLTEDALRMVNVWSPLVPARAENGCMQFVPGTHKLGLVPHDDREHYLEISDDALKPQLERAIDVILDPGDVVFFSNLLFHRGQPNHSDSIRWSCDWRYQDARQSTMRSETGHIARSQSDPSVEVKSPEAWTELSFV